MQNSNKYCNLDQNDSEKFRGNRKSRPDIKYSLLAIGLVFNSIELHGVDKAELNGGCKVADIVSGTSGKSRAMRCQI